MYDLGLSFGQSAQASASLSAPTTFNFSSPGTVVGPTTSNANPQASITPTVNAGDQQPGGGLPAYTAPSSGFGGLSTKAIVIAVAAGLLVLVIMKHK